MVELSSTASLSSLPIEIKTLIVYYSFLQDESYQFRINSSDEAVSELTEDVLGENRWRGHSLNALFLTDTCFSNLSAFYLFKILDRRAASSTRYKHLVSPRRSPLFREIKLFGADVNNLKDLLSAAHTHSKIETMEITANAFSLLLGDLADFGTSEDEELDAMYHSFKRLGETIKHLILVNFSCESSLYSLRLFPNLNSLEIGFNLIADGSTEDEDVERELGLLLLNSSLVHINFKRSLTYVPTAWLVLDWSLSSISSLTLYTETFTTPYFDFISKFSTTLTNLDVTYKGPELSSPAVIPATFSMLRKLRLVGKRNNLKALVERLKTPSLVSLRLQSNEALFPPTEEVMIKLLSTTISSYPLLRRLIFCDRFSRPELFTSLADACVDLSITLEFGESARQYINDPGLIWNPADPQEQLIYERGLQSALKYGERKLLNLKKEEDLEGLKEMFENCQWLRANAAEMMD